MRFAKEFPDDLRLQIPTSDVISKKVILKKRGSEYSGLCPFHNEKTPSFTVNDQKGFFHCFGCGAHGDIIGFVMQQDGLDFKDAVIKLANDYNITIPFIKTEKGKETENKTTRQYLLLETACQFFQDNLFQYQGKLALDYLNKRGLDKDNIKKFRLGFAIESFDNLITHLKKHGFNEAELTESGIIGKNQKGNLYDKFRGRIIFPISNKMNKIIAFGGRSMGDNQPKYLNSSETSIFKKGRNLYNYSNARKSIYENKFACLVEGYMDVIALDISGIGNIIAPLGTAITNDQIKELFKITEDIVVCLDGDTAGINAMRRVIDIALPIINPNNLVRFTFLPAKTDPDDFIKSYGKIAMQDLLNNASNLSEVLFNYEAKDLGITNLDSKITPEKKAQLEARLIQKTNLITDPNSKKHFLQYYKNRLFEIGRNKSVKPHNFIKNSSNLNNFSAHNPNYDEIYVINIIKLLVQYPKLIDYQDNYYNMRQLHFNNEELSNLKELIIDFIDNEVNYESKDIITYLDNLPLYQNLKNKISFNNKITYELSGAETRLRILILKYHHHQVSQQYSEILNEIDQVETSEFSIKNGKQKELFDHKTALERKILQLESDIV
jgi:DNA primase